MRKAFICDAIRTPVGKYGGALSGVRPDDLAAGTIKALMRRNPDMDWNQLDDVLLGCANQAGEDNRNIGRMAALLAGLPDSIPGATINRLCGSGMDAIGIAARAIIAGEADIIVAGGVESMSRAPYVMDKPNAAFDRNVKMYDTTIGWRFINPLLHAQYGTESMPETAENIAKEYQISRSDQDAFAQWSQAKADRAAKENLFHPEIVPVVIPQRNGEASLVTQDEHPRLSTIEKLAALKPITGPNGTITAGNASGVNDGAAALLIASQEAVKKYRLNPLAEIKGMAVAGVAPRLMGLGPVPAIQKILQRLNLQLEDFDIIELNEAFAAQAIGCTRLLNLVDNDPRINPYGGAIALGHPLGMSGARIVTTAVNQLIQNQSKFALTSMCIGVGQGIAMVLERCR